MTTYQANVSRDGAFWFIDIPALGIATQARALRDVERMATDVIALTLDVPESEVSVDAQVDPGASVHDHMVAARRLREQALSANAAAAAETRAAARELRDAGVTVRDIGAVFGVSHQRAAQLLK